MKIIVLFGGESVEHEISIISANQVMQALSINHKITPIYISKENKMYYHEDFKKLETFKNIKKYLKNSNEITLYKSKKVFFIKRKIFKKKIRFDLAFPIVHGKGMEDGTLLSYLKFLKLPVVADSLSFYALAQNKSLTKHVLNDLKINNTPFQELNNYEELNKINLEYPLIVKPNALGSSIGIKKVKNKKELKEALLEAFEFDSKVIVEQFLEDSREFNISVTQKKDKIIVSNIEEIMKSNEIFNYKDKYENDQKIGMSGITKKKMPADIDNDLKDEIERTAVEIYKMCEAKGVIRIDFLYKDKLYVNEINAIPGSYSFYLWKGKMDFVELLDTVIDTSKRDIFKNNKLIRTIDKMDIFNSLNSTKTKLK